MSSLGQSIQQARKQRGLRQCDLATLACVSLKHICFLEQGRRVGSPTVIRIIGDVLGVDLTALHEAEQQRLQRVRRWQS